MLQWSWVVDLKKKHPAIKLLPNGSKYQIFLYEKKWRRSSSILKLQKNGKNKNWAPKLIFLNKEKEIFIWFLTLNIDFENQILAHFDCYFWPFIKSHAKINTVFVISTIRASIWNVFIKFRCHGEKLTIGQIVAIWIWIFFSSITKFIAIQLAL